MDTYTTAEGVYSYTYDANGNILTISKDGVLLEAYTYDSLNQLKTVTKGADIYEYTYDNGGNILNVKLNGAVTDTYTYGDENWKDKLTVYNGQTLTYDSIGNPLTYRDGMAMTWQNGRQLYTLDNSAVGITNSYNIDGLRTEKTVLNKTANTTVTYSYEYNGNLLVRQAWNENIMWFLYDESGNSVGFTLNGTEYYYIKNVQGDITAIADSTGTILAKYSYDAWGKLLSVTDAYGNDVSANASHIANINPLRYRGYYYDVETGFYYLQSRYYDPVTRRFINADGYVSTGQGFIGFNMFAYCGNNPVNRADPSGQGWIGALIITAVVVTVAVIVNTVKNIVIDKQKNINDTEKEVAKKDPIGAIQGNKSKDIANEYQKKLYPNTYQKDANQANAFKHAMWNAVMTDKIGEQRAKKFADAHEMLTNNPIELMEMDLHNNALGRKIALEYAGQGYDVFAQKIQDAIIEGEAYVIEWDMGN